VDQRNGRDMNLSQKNICICKAHRLLWWCLFGGPAAFFLNTYTGPLFFFFVNDIKISGVTLVITRATNFLI